MSGFKQPIISLLGPRLITAFFMCIMTGVIINQSIRFWTSAHTERLAIRILVAWATTLALYVLIYSRVSDCTVRLTLLHTIASTPA